MTVVKAETVVSVATVGTMVGRNGYVNGELQSMQKFYRLLKRAAVQFCPLYIKVNSNVASFFFV